jgi:hypothetical protein
VQMESSLICSQQGAATRLRDAEVLGQAVLQVGAEKKTKADVYLGLVHTGGGGGRALLLDLLSFWGAYH